MRFRRAALFALIVVAPLHAQQPEGAQAKPVLDRYLDPLPSGAFARLGIVTELGPSYETFAVFSPDGRTLATSNDNDLLLWDVASGQVKHRLKRHEYFLSDLAFNPAGDQLVSLGRSLLCVWNVADGRLLRETSVPSIWERHGLYALSPDGQHLLQRQRAGDKLVFDHEDLRTGRKATFEVDGPPHAAFVFDGKRLVVSGVDPKEGGDVRVFDFATRKLLAQQRSKDRVSGAAISADGRWLAFMTYRDHTPGERFSELKLLDLEGKIALKTLSRGDKNEHYHALRFSPDSRWLAACHGAGKIEAWPLEGDMACRTHPPADFHWPRSLAWSRDSRTVVVPDTGGQVSLWRPADGATRRLTDDHAFRPRQLAFSPDKKLLAASGEQGKLAVWDLATRTIILRKTGLGHVDRLAFSPDGKLLLVQDSSKPAHLLRVPSGEPLDSLARLGFHVNGFSPDGAALVVSRTSPGKLAAELPMLGMARAKPWTHQQSLDWLRDQALLTWRFATTPELSPLRWTQFDGSPRITGPAGYLFDYDHVMVGNPFSGAGARPVVDGVRLLNSNTAEEIRRFQGKHPVLEARWFSPDSKAFFTSDSKNSDIIVHETITGGQRLQLRRPGTRAPGTVRSLAARADLLVAVFDDGVHLWNLHTGAHLRLLCGPPAKDAMIDGVPWQQRPDAGRIALLHGAQTHSLAFSRDGRWLAGGADGGPVVLWDLSTMLPKAPPTIPLLDAKTLDKLWSDLADSNAAIAHRAMRTLLVHPGPAKRLLRERLHVADRRQLVEQSLHDLDHADFARRQQAMRTLEQLGDLARPLLQAELDAAPTLEKRRRLERLLQDLERPYTSSGSLRLYRCLEILERFGGEDVIQVFREFSSGTPFDRLSREAEAARNRMQGR